MGNSNTPGVSMTTTPSPYGGFVRQWSQPFDLDLQSVAGDSFIDDDDRDYTAVSDITGNRLKLNDFVDDIPDDKDCSTYDIDAKSRKQRSCDEEYQQEAYLASYNVSDMISSSAIKQRGSLTGNTLLRDCLFGHAENSTENISQISCEDYEAHCSNHPTTATDATNTSTNFTYTSIDDCISKCDDCDNHTSPRFNRNRDTTHAHLQTPCLSTEDSLTSSTSSQHSDCCEGKLRRSDLISHRILTIHDTPGHVQNFVAMLCAPQEDLVGFTLPFHRELERWGFRIFLQERDLLVGGNVFEELSTVVEERCNGKIIIILSRHYPASGECQFLTHFARHLDPDAKRRAIVPVLIDKHVLDLPNVLTGISLIRYNHAFRTGWLKRKMIEAIAI